jgi:predicted esterase
LRVEERTIAVTTHGRYLVAAPVHQTPATSRLRASSSLPSFGEAGRSAEGAEGAVPVLVGFHGYGEDAAAHLTRLRTIPDVDRWLLVSVQGLHRFYQRRSEEVVASWMTRQDRDLMIADNIAYVSAVIDAVSREWNVSNTIVLAGFSQGVATAFRAAARGSHAVRGVLALGGDVPPDLEPHELARVPAALIGRGVRDEWYTSSQHMLDEARLRAAGAIVNTRSFDAGHEWTADFSAAAGDFLAGLW